MKMINYTLPEFVFLDGNTHTGNSLENRTVIQHIRSYSIFEVIALDEVLTSDFKAKSYEFEYKNNFGIVEKHLLLLHFSLAENEELEEVFAKTAKWYKAYLNWEDQNIITDETAKHN